MLVFRRESFRIEFPWIRPEFRIVMDEPGRSHDRRSGRDRVAHDLPLLHSQTTNVKRNLMKINEDKIYLGRQNIQKNENIPDEIVFNKLFYTK